MTHLVACVDHVCMHAAHPHSQPDAGAYHRPHGPCPHPSSLPLYPWVHSHSASYRLFVVTTAIAHTGPDVLPRAHHGPHQAKDPQGARLFLSWKQHSSPHSAVDGPPNVDRDDTTTPSQHHHHPKEDHHKESKHKLQKVCAHASHTETALETCPRQSRLDHVHAPTPPFWFPRLTTQHHDKEHHDKESIRIRVCNPCPDNLHHLRLKVRIPCASLSSDDLCAHMSSLRLLHLEAETRVEGVIRGLTRVCTLHHIHAHAGGRAEKCPRLEDPP
jgi:hypothetical protein